MTRQDLPQDADRDQPEVSDVPAGGGGADDGAAGTVGVADETDADVQNVSSQNDIAGVGTRGPDGVESSTDGAIEVEQTRRSADPDFARDDEAAGAAAHNLRVSTRDSDEPSRARNDERFQHLPRMAQNAPTSDEELAGIVAQTRADLALGIAGKRVPDILRQRLEDAGIEHDDDVVEELARRVLDE